MAMGVQIRLFFVILILISMGSNSELVAAQNSSNLRSDRIQISYVPPNNSAHEPIFQLLKERRAPRKIQGTLKPIAPAACALIEGRGMRRRYPTRGMEMTLSLFATSTLTTSCGMLPRTTTPAGVTRTDAIVGPTLEVFLHEFGHAVFDYLSVPILGREEDAADQFAAYLLLQFAKSDARRLMVGVAYSYNIDASQPSTKTNPFADEHGLPAQRFYNVLCMAYGADSRLFVDLVEKGYLPKERAEGCADEYAQVAFAMKKLIRPYVDQKQAKRVRAKQWLRFDVQ